MEDIFKYLKKKKERVPKAIKNRRPKYEGRGIRLNDRCLSIDREELLSTLQGAMAAEDVNYTLTIPTAYQISKV
ncbi:Hypothetical predicted protein [Cloeon dipterum]|uniref:Uncharacterized protein n=1 Tax=Cloeon dipterum TaxID=197152 RepID=A0A8S1D6D5_9INSE|nr:Hypothetical predicted protein [Cloeon dipterum]